MSLLQESLSVAVKTGAMRPEDTRRVIVDTTVQPKNIMFPTDANRQVRPDPAPALCPWPEQFKRAARGPRTLRTYLGRTIRDITRQIAGEDDLSDIFRKDLHLASRVLEQRQNQRGKKV